MDAGKQVTIRIESSMNITFIVVAAAIFAGVAGAQETKPVPKNSVRVFIPGCSKGMMFTAGSRTEDEPGGSAVPQGTHVRMTGPKKVIAEIKDQEGSKIEI